VAERADSRAEIRWGIHFPESRRVHEKLLMTSSVTARRRSDETFLARMEKARQDALEMAQEADAPAQTGTEDAATLTGRFSAG
jgi:hypothetical protein